MNVTAAIPASPGKKRSGDFQVWTSALLTLIIVSLLAGVAAIFHIPVGLVPLLLPIAMAFWIIIRAVKHNRGLFQSLGARALFGNLFVTFLLFSPILPIVTLGLFFGTFVSYSLNRCVDRLNEWSAPAIVSVQTEKKIEQTVKELMKRNLPWWYAPALWLHVVPEYATQVRIEVQTITEIINISTPQPWRVRATAGALKFFLQSLSIASTTWCALLLLQLFFGLFGRRLLSQHGSIRIILCRDEDTASPALQKFETNASTGLSVKLRHEETLFVRSSDLPTGAVPDVSFRFSGGASFARLLYKLVMMSRITTEHGEEVVFHASAGAQYISVRLEQGQQVVVDPHALVAFSNSVHFQRHWDFNIAVVGLHHIFYLIAEGPGLVVLRAKGEPLIMKEACEMPALPMERILAFDARASFHVLASAGVLNYVLSPSALKADKGDLFVAGPVDALQRSVFAKLWKFIKHCYFPI